MKAKEATIASTSILRVRSMFSLPFGCADPKAASRRVPWEAENAPKVERGTLTPVHAGLFPGKRV